MTASWHWSAQPANLALSTFAHRAAARGIDIRLTDTGYSGPDMLSALAERCGLRGEMASAPSGAALRLPRIVLYAGDAIGYPYYAYYSHALWSLGLLYERATALDLAGGALDHADVFVIPGGFATWGLDRIEGTAGVDAAVERFIARGGACIASCGGTFYLSEGRPGWLGAIDAKPRFTHEYLLTGTCLLNVCLTDPGLRRDLPQMLELPYYHGPVYEVDAARHARTLATFGEHVLPNRLFIDNPIDAARYGDILRNRVAVISGRTPAHRIVGFSAHPEMGEFLRKAIVLDGYVRHYLPLRGAKTMQETMRFYAKEDCIAFRLILNAAISLGAFRVDPGNNKPKAPAAAVPSHTKTVDKSNNTPSSPQRDQDWRTALAHLRDRLARDETPGIAALVEIELTSLEQEWQALAQARADLTDDTELQRVLVDALTAVAPPGPGQPPVSRSCPEALVLLELPVRLLAARARISAMDKFLEQL